MNIVHVHLLLTHAPIFTSLIGLGILVLALARRSAELRGTAYGLLVIAAVFSVLVYVTGEASEDAVKQVAGVTDASIEQHADAAKFSLVGSVALGIVAAFGLFARRIAARFTAATTAAVLVLGAAVSLSFALTANLGGQIRHTEMQSGAASSVPSHQTTREDHD
ncbi:MAG TPA: DUF2231 domain-containing protein [Candidatus Limnocylindria bacterium]|jgi:uncharacterized membrane protein|nr:DUF2231 domain-containing protein [Candidatus Limnocylindria bacterium]